MIEAELKARVRDVEAVQRWLRERATEEPATYHDTYYDWPDHRLDTEGREIRLRTIETPTSTTRVLTYKQPPVGPESGSKPEYETEIADPGPVGVMLRDLGLVELVSLTKRCQNFRFKHGDHEVIATLVTVPELIGTFIEVEIPAPSDQIGRALITLRNIISELGLLEYLDSSSYTRSVINARQKL